MFPGKHSSAPTPPVGFRVQLLDPMFPGKHLETHPARRWCSRPRRGAARATRGGRQVSRETSTPRAERRRAKYRVRGSARARLRHVTGMEADTYLPPQGGGSATTWSRSLPGGDQGGLLLSAAPGMWCSAGAEHDRPLAGCSQSAAPASPLPAPVQNPSEAPPLRGGQAALTGRPHGSARRGPVGCADRSEAGACVRAQPARDRSDSAPATTTAPGTTGRRADHS